MRVDLAKFAARVAGSRLSVGELAETCGLKKRQIHKWLILADMNLGGEPTAELPVNTVNAISHMLRCTPADLEYHRGGQ